MTRTVTTAIVGAGFGGIAAAANLRRQGQDDITILERGDSIGGVWRANTYPGLACDVPSHLYSLSFAPNPRWTQRFSQRRGDPGLPRRTSPAASTWSGTCGSTPTCMRAAFDETAGRWRLEIANGEQVEAEVLITACGQLTRPAIPEMPGLGEFEGRGVPLGALARRRRCSTGRRVAVIGTGASAIQFVPAIAPHVCAHDGLPAHARLGRCRSPTSPTPIGHRRLYERAPWLQKAVRQALWTMMEATGPGLHPAARAGRQGR